MVWHHTLNGEYTVKYGYGVAMNLMENVALGKKGRGGPSDTSKHQQTWKKVWSLQVKDKENASDLCQDFAFGLWRLWKSRNEIVFNGIYHQPLEVLEMWRKNTSEYREALAWDSLEDCTSITKPNQEMQSSSKQWQKPSFGTIKINTDAAWCKHTMRSGMGWLGRDFAGVLQAAGGSGVGYCHSAAAAKASTIREALKMCIDHEFQQMVIEFDAKAIILMLRKEVAPDFSIECILGDIEVMARRLKVVAFNYVPRECNRSAHSVAKFVFKEDRTFTWVY
ncbi:uncharacterized protein [Malus domestica]|uniref:uncharacterized protein n=1 Tax=Malus domestica TaxID=3750 RepID=UPI00397602E9